MFSSYGNWQSGLHDLVNEMNQQQWRKERVARGAGLPDIETQRKRQFEDADQLMQQQLHDSQLKSAGQQQDLLGIKVQDERNARTEPSDLEEAMAQIKALWDGGAPAAGPSVAAVPGIGAGVLAPGSVNADAKYARAIPQGWQPDAGAPEPSAAGPGVDVAQAAASLASGGVQTGSSAGPINSDQNWQRRGGGSVPPAGFVPRGAGARAGTPMGWTASMAPRLRSPDAVSAVQGEMGTTRLPPPVSGVRDVAAEVSGVMTSPTGQMSSGRRSTQLDQATEAFARMPDQTRFYLTGKHSPLDAAQGWVEQQQGAALGQRKAEAPLPIDPRTEMSAADTANGARLDKELQFKRDQFTADDARKTKELENRHELAKLGWQTNPDGTMSKVGVENPSDAAKNRMEILKGITPPAITEINPATGKVWTQDEQNKWKDAEFDRTVAKVYGRPASGGADTTSPGAGAPAKPGAKGEAVTRGETVLWAAEIEERRRNGEDIPMGNGSWTPAAQITAQLKGRGESGITPDNFNEVVGTSKQALTEGAQTAAAVNQKGRSWWRRNVFLPETGKETPLRASAHGLIDSGGMGMYPEERQANIRQVNGLMDMPDHPSVKPSFDRLLEGGAVDLARVQKAVKGGFMKEKDAESALRSIVAKSQPQIEDLQPERAIELLTGVLMTRLYGVERAINGR